MDKNCQRHKEYVRTVISEMYPEANLNKDIFLIVQPVFPKDDEGHGEDGICCLVDIYRSDQKASIPLHTELSHPYQNRSVAVSGSRYGAASYRVGQEEDFVKQLLRIEGGKKISDIGVVIRMKEFEKLQKIESVQVVWDYGFAATTQVFAIRFIAPRHCENCYFLRSEVPNDWEKPQEKCLPVAVDEADGHAHLYIPRKQGDGREHYIHYYQAVLRPTPLGEDISIAGASKKYMKWKKGRD